MSTRRPRPSRPLRHAAAATVLLLVGAAVAACGDDDPGALPTSPAPSSEADTS